MDAEHVEQPGQDTAEAPGERTFVKPQTLFELLRALSLIDEAMLEIDLNESPDLMQGGKVKVDNYKYLIDKMQAMREELKGHEDEYKTARQTIENQIERLKAHMIYALEANQFDQFAGNQYKVRMQYSEFVDLKLSTPSDMHAIHLGDSVIKTTREWKKAEIKKLLKLTPGENTKESDIKLAEKVREFAALAKRPGIRFSVLKDI